MTNDISNTLLADGFDLPSTPYTKPIPPSAVTSIIDDALKPEADNCIGCPSCAALEEHNANQAREIDELKLEVRELRERLAGREFD